jgi:tRNA(Ile)-lysidine synthase
METFIFNLSRGASVSGLCGIPYVRDIYVRPLLECSRDEIEEYIRVHSLDYVTDSTNLCNDYTRNKIRHNIIPQLFELNSSFDSAFAKCNHSLRVSNDYIMINSVELLEKSRCDGFYDCSILRDVHSALKYSVISLILKENNAKNITREHIESVLWVIKTGGSVDAVEAGTNTKNKPCLRSLHSVVLIVYTTCSVPTIGAPKAYRQGLTG